MDYGLGIANDKPEKARVVQDRFDNSPSFLAFGKAGGLQIRCCQGLAVAKLGALALKPSGFSEGLTPFILEIDQL
jgi:hypothetical protein